jgi:hypothetical protein
MIHDVNSLPMPDKPYEKSLWMGSLPSNNYSLIAGRSTGKPTFHCKVERAFHPVVSTTDRNT